MRSSPTHSDPTSDEIIDEVRATRDAIAARFGYDVDALFRHAQARRLTSTRQVVAFEPREARPDGAAARHLGAAGTSA